MLGSEKERHGHRMANYLGTVLDNRYEMLEIIGTGGMAVVYKARDVKLNRYVAVKILKDEILQDDELRSRFHAEAEAVAAMSHPNIVSIFDVSITKRMEYFVMELIDGITLKQYMQQRKILSEAELQLFISQILKALEHAHSRNIVHRDIKPQNVMILRDGTVKVTDFGIARMANHQQTVTQNAFGSVHYIAPEQAKGGMTDGRTDLYSVGIIMYEMLTGELPFTGETPVAVAIQHLSSEPPSPMAKNPKVRPGMEAIVLKAMATDPDDRYASATEMLSDMEAYKQNPLIPVGLYKEKAVGDEEGEETLPTKEVGKIEQNNRGEYVTPSPKTKRKRQKAQFKYNEKLPVLAGVLSAFIFLIVAVVVFLSLLKGCGSDSGEPVELPNLVGKTYEQVVEELGNDPRYQFLKVKKGEEVFSDDQEAGTVIAQNPIAGSTVKSNATITLDVSLGIREIQMIDIIGKDYSEGANKLANLFTQNKINNVIIVPTYEMSDTVPMNIIIRTDPVMGETVRSGDEIYVYISSGTEEAQKVMPNLYGMSLAQAIKILTEQQIEFDQVVEEYNDAPEGTIIGQSIAKDTVLKDSDRVDLLVSKGPMPVETETETETETESETTSEVESETTSETETETATESETSSSTQPGTGSASYTFQPAALASQDYTESDVLQVTIKANGISIWYGASVTIASADISVTQTGTKGESCVFEVYVGSSSTPFTSYVEEFE